MNFHFFNSPYAAFPISDMQAEKKVTSSDTVSLKKCNCKIRGGGGKHVRKYAPRRDALCRFVIKTGRGNRRRCCRVRFQEFDESGVRNFVGFWIAGNEEGIRQLYVTRMYFGVALLQRRRMRFASLFQLCVYLVAP